MGSKRRAQRSGIASVADFLAEPLADGMAFGEIEVPEERGGGVLPAFFLKFPKGTAALSGNRNEDEFRLKVGLVEVGRVAIILMTYRVAPCPEIFVLVVDHHGEGAFCRPFDRLADAGRYAVVALEQDSSKPVWTREFPTNKTKHVVLSRKLAALPPWTEDEFQAAMSTFDLRQSVRNMYS